MKLYKKIRNITLIVLCGAIFIIGFIKVNMTCTKREEGYNKLLSSNSKNKDSYEKIFAKWSDNAPIKVYEDGAVFMKIYLKKYDLVVYRDNLPQIKENFQVNFESLKNTFMGKLNGDK